MRDKAKRAYKEERDENDPISDLEALLMGDESASDTLLPVKITKEQRRRFDEISQRTGAPRSKIARQIFDSFFSGELVLSSKKTNQK